MPDAVIVPTTAHSPVRVVASKLSETIEGVAPPLYREPGLMIGTVADVSVKVLAGLEVSVKTRSYEAEKFLTPSLRTLMLKS